ncbi:MAG: phosphoglycerate kinase [Chlamydiia bacterium]|nr:phosphoglycerate kinase [Chlamydiia bacterium]
MGSIVPLKDLPINGKKVLMRVDFNTPLNDQGEVTDDARIKAALPTIEWILSQGASLILMSHLGRPKGEKNLKYTLRPVAERLSELLKEPVQFSGLDKAADLKPGEVLLLENLRFNPAEENPDLDPGFAKELASVADVYVNDAFGTAHRKHSSVTEVPKYFRQKAAGFLMEKEIEVLKRLMENPTRPFVVILGGIKLSTKLGVVKALSDKADKILIGGAMAYTYLKDRGVKVGDSLVENDVEPFKTDKIELPIDVVAEKHGETATFSVKEGIPDGYQGMDIGPETTKRFCDEILKAKTVFWNGPMGKFEDPRFSNGTFGVMQALADTDAYTLIGGGDSLLAAKESGLSEKIDHLSTGGGASLKFLEKGSLPGVESLVD